MIRNRILLRTLSVFFIVNLLLGILTPTISYALTSGPTAPEATSFEPVDTTDMVNLLTGDLTYNIPLLEVPGPAGGYPISLSYHAGIQPNEEASWVGLGWTLNPGAISRFVNGYPDDQENATSYNRIFWEGGETETYTVGVNVGITKVASVSAGLNFSQDTYEGFGVGGYIGTKIKPLEGSESKIGGDLTVGIAPHGGMYVSGGVNNGLHKASFKASKSGAMATYGYGPVSINSNGIASLKAGPISVSSNGKTSFFGASIGSSGTSFSAKGVGIQASNHFNKVSKVSSSSSDLNFDIPVLPGFSVRLGRSYVRYWIDETDAAATFGSLYFPESKTDADEADDLAFDTYDAADLTKNIARHPNYDKVLGGSFADYDSYSVNAQGVSGNIRPYHYQKKLVRQNKKDGDTYITKHYPLEYESSKPYFRFVHDFSNRYLFDPEDFEGTTDLRFNFSNSSDPLIGDSQFDGYYDNQLAGSKHIDYFTNLDIMEGAANGYIGTRSRGLDRRRDSKIGSFRITNETGVTYHYSLPAYAYNEVRYSEKRDKSDGLKFNSIDNSDSYAYTWYLTAVTGPDFVDRNGNNLADKDDWGYWVDFEYGKWSEHNWRNPGTGFNIDLDGEFQNFSKGVKEVYYLDAIRTQSHTAVFVKEIRADAKASNAPYRNAIDIDDSHNVVSKDEGNFQDQTREFFYDCNCEEICDTDTDPDCRSSEVVCDRCPFGYTVPTKSSLKLNKIYLLRNSDFTWDLPGRSNNYDHFDSYSYEEDVYEFVDGQGWIITTEEKEYVYDYHYGSNVIDTYDILGIQSVLTDKSIRSIDFNTDYSLTNGTINSYFSSMDARNTNISPDAAEVNRGKLTLNSLKFLGKNGTDFIPPMNFSYDADKNFSYDQEYYDVWGHYKSDYIAGNNNTSRAVSTNSSENVDAWSLTGIETSLGAEIEIDYSSDSYHESILQNNYSLVAEDVSLREPDLVDFTIAGNLDLPSIMDENANINMLFSYFEETLITCSDASNPDDGIEVSSPTINSYNLSIEDLQGSVLTIRNQNIHNILSYEERIDGDHGDPENEICQEDKTNIMFAANISIASLNKPGGGLKVDKINVSNPHSDINRSTIYDYNIPGTNHSSGVTSYEPLALDAFIFRYSSVTDGLKNPDEIVDLEEDYKATLYDNYDEIISLSRDLPGPGIMYKTVKVEEEVVHPDGSTYRLPQYSVYQFEVFNKGMIGIEGQSDPPVTTNRTLHGINYKKKATRSLALKDYTSRIGNLKSVALYSRQTNAKISETINHYLSDELSDDSFQANIDEYESLLDQYDDQGVIQETFANGRFAQQGEDGIFEDLNEDDYYLLGVLSKREVYPNIQIGVTDKNYVSGLSTTTENLEFDFFNGTVTKTLNTDSYGNSYVDEVLPAYRIPAYNEMGLRTEGTTNKNMLQQEAASFSYKVNDNYKESPSNSNIIGLIGSNIQTWDKSIQTLQGSDFEVLTNHWRKHRTYTFTGSSDVAQNSDGTYDFSTFLNGESSARDVFSWWSAGSEPLENSGWRKNSEITLNDVYAHPLEMVDMNGNFSSTRMNFENEFVIATTINSGYWEMAYTGAEELTEAFREGGVTFDASTSVIVNDQSHTGEKSLAVNEEGTGFIFEMDVSPGKDYFASVWVYATLDNMLDNLSISCKNATTDIELVNTNSSVTNIKASAWNLINLTISKEELVEVSKIKLVCENRNTSGLAYFDDFRVHPLEASLTSYVYDSFSKELTHILNDNNFYTRFEYDDAGRLIGTYQEIEFPVEKRVSKQYYQYSRN
ncbi:MAG: hypothetical protein AAF363_22295 [Bacteroidota bacterium]